MDQHPIPRQITTFEFKLIGPMTIRQFGYVLLTGVLGYGVFLAIPVKILNIVCGLLVFSVGPIFAFVKPNDRPLDVFFGNLYRRLTSPTQYIYEKRNPPLPFFDSLYFDANPHIVVAHVESKEKLEGYLLTKQNSHKEDGADGGRKGVIGDMLTGKLPPIPVQEPPATTEQNTHKPAVSTPQVAPTQTKHPFLTGVVYNTRHIPLPGVLLYIKNGSSEAPIRILKTNPHGIFATFNPLADGDYTVEIKDSSGGYVFDPQTIHLASVEKHYFEFVSKDVV